MEIKEQIRTLDTLAWNIGSYVLDGMATMFGRHSTPYPSMPRSMSKDDAPTGKKGEVMTDGAKFAAFASVHNRQMREQRNS